MIDVNTFVGGLLTVAAIWVGMALFLTAFAFTMSDALQIVLGFVGAWLVAVASAYVIATPGTARCTSASDASGSSRHRGVRSRAARRAWPSRSHGPSGCSR